MLCVTINKKQMNHLQQLKKATQLSSVNSPSAKLLASAEKNDFIRYKDWRRRVKRLRRFIFFTDLHLPFYCPRSVDLLYQIAGDFKPDIYIDGGDFFDFPKISKFEDHRTTFEQLWDSDPHYAIEADRAFTAGLTDASPRAIKVRIPSNHVARLKSYLMSNASDFSGYTMHHFWSDIRDHGWLMFDSFLLGHEHLVLNDALIASHGKGGGQITSALKKMQAYTGGVYSVMFGHWHQNAYKHLVLPDGRVVESFACGCMCQLQPHYKTGLSQWQNGIIIGDFMPNGAYYSAQHIPFRSYNGMLMATVHGKTYKA